MKDWQGQLVQCSYEQRTKTNYKHTHTTERTLEQKQLQVNCYKRNTKSSAEYKYKGIEGPQVQ